ncbi:MAG: vWA domain-containing protein, partial [Chthoniobacteraceae bacterium]
TAAGAVPAKPASMSARGGAAGLSDSENEFLGKDYSMRNFREEAEKGRGYALVVPTPLPGLQPPAVPQPEDFYKQLAPPAPDHNTEAYDAIQDNRFLMVKDNPLSTFSIDVDTASYSNVRRFLTGGALPPKGAVRIEELVNYFSYDYPQPQGADPFSATLEVATCPWEPKHRLLRVGLKGRELPKDQRPPSNLVFLIDVSGSMQPQNKLPLVKESLQQMIAELGPKDTVAIAVYSGASGTVLEPTSDRDAIRAALSRLEAGGSTNGASGIQLAYDLAKKSFNKEGNNRVILATDGDFNVGVTNRSELVDLIEKRAKEGVFLTVLGFGMGNLKDATLEQLADKGNGNYAYIDSIREGRKVLVEEMAGTLFTIAKDVKIQVEFNPAQVSAYRLIGYENRLLAKEDFNDDKKDAGEIGAGHTVTALYQIVPAGVAIESPGVDPLKYQPKPEAAPAPAVPVEGASKEMLTLKLRFKQPDDDTSTLREFPLTDAGLTWERSSRDFRFAAAVASFGMLLRDSPHKGSSNWDSTMELAVEGKGEDAGGYRQEFIGLLEKAKSLQPAASAK